MLLTTDGVVRLIGVSHSSEAAVAAGAVALVLFESLDALAEASAGAVAGASGTTSGPVPTVSLVSAAASTHSIPVLYGAGMSDL